MAERSQNVLGVEPVAPARRVKTTDPCAGCPAEKTPVKVPARVPDGARLVVLTDMPSHKEVLDGELRDVGSHVKQLQGLVVGRACVTRCRPPDSDDKTLRDMQRHCRAHLIRDLPPGSPLLVSDAESLAVVHGNRERGLSQLRGLWARSVLEDRGRGLRWDGRFYAIKPNSPRWDSDLERFVRGLDPASAPKLSDLRIVTDPREDEELMAWIAELQTPWAFDTESYDAAQTPSRVEVATDACHPDFRLRGVAVAWSEDEGAWLELHRHGKDVWRPYLDAAFGSAAKKCAHNGSHDEDVLVYNGWCGEVANRGEDSMLAMVSLSDGRHPSLRLERIAVDVLGVDQWWDAADKSLMRDLPIEQVARAAVFDAGLSLWVCTHAQDMMESGQYWDGL